MSRPDHPIPVSCEDFFLHQAHPPTYKMSAGEGNKLGNDWLEISDSIHHVVAMHLTSITFNQKNRLEFVKNPLPRLARLYSSVNRADTKAFTGLITIIGAAVVEKVFKQKFDFCPVDVYGDGAKILHGEIHRRGMKAPFRHVTSCLFLQPLTLISTT